MGKSNEKLQVLHMGRVVEPEVQQHEPNSSPRLGDEDFSSDEWVRLCHHFEDALFENGVNGGINFMRIRSLQKALDVVLYNEESIATITEEQERKISAEIDAALGNVS